MDRIIEQLSKVRFSDSDELDPESFFLRIKLYYEQNHRHKYSEISKVIYEFKDDRIDILRINLTEIKNLVKDDISGLDDKIDKLIDHSDLAEYQRKLIEDVGKEQKVLIKGYQSQIDKTKKQLESIKEEVEKEMIELGKTKSQLDTAREELKQTSEKVNNSYNETFKEIEKLKKDTSGIYTQFITILGIFTAIIIGVFGGMQLLENVMSNMENVKITKLLMFSSLIMGAIFTILYLLLISIAALTNKPIKNCGCNKDKECTHSLFKRHPIYIIGMMSSLYFFVIGTIAHGFGTENLNGLLYLDRLMQNGFNMIIISLSLLLLFIGLIYILNKTPKRKS